LGEDAQHGLDVRAADRVPPKGLLVVFNPLDEPLDEPLDRTLCGNLYYTGLTGQVEISEEGGAAKPVPLERDYTINLPVHVPARGMTWFVMR
jgi:hypothetical protein